MPDLLALGRRVLASQPFSVLLGAELVAFGEGHAQIEVPMRDELMQQHGIVHGGVVSYAADNAIAFAAGSVLREGVVTSEVTIGYLKPAKGDVLTARAVVVHQGRNRAVCRCEIFFAGGLCAIAEGTAVTFRP